MGVLTVRQLREVTSGHFHSVSQSVMLNFSPAILPGLLLLSQVEAWGGVFNRYNPSLHSSYVDTSGNYYNLMTDSKHHVEEPRMVEKQIAELLEEEAAAEADPCHERKCTSNEHCCDGMVCVDTSNGVTGSCLPVFGKKSGENCYQDADCETGYVCVDDTCSEPAPGWGSSVRSAGTARTVTSIRDSAAGLPGDP